MNKRHELLREAASNLPAFHDEERKAVRDTIEIEADLVKALEDAIAKLRKAGLASGSGVWAIESMIEPFVAALTKAKAGA